MDSVFCIQGQPLYVRIQSYKEGSTNYLVGTYGSPESPVSVSVKGKDSSSLRLVAATRGLSLILEGSTYN